jgi:GGDEF domain-containing protein
MNTYTLFSLLLVRVEELGNFAKHWSTECRAQVLLALQDRLMNCVGTLDRIHLLDEGEFLVVMRCSLARAKERAAHIRTIVNAAYRVELPFGTAEITITSTIGGVEYISGEDIASLKARAEQALRGGASSSESDLLAELEQVV